MSVCMCVHRSAYAFTHKHTFKTYAYAHASLHSHADHISTARNPPSPESE